jgi:hypothetical protein
MPSDIKEEVKAVLKNMPIHSSGRSYLTAYQILERLPSTTRDRLMKERGTPGLGSGKYYAAASVVSDAAEMISNIEIALLETSSLSIKLRSGEDIEPGNKNVGLYRLLNH